MYHFRNNKLQNFNTLAIIYSSNMNKLKCFKVYLNGLLIFSYTILYALLESIKGSRGWNFSEVYQQKHKTNFKRFIVFPIKGWTVYKTLWFACNEVPYYFCITPLALCYYTIFFFNRDWSNTEKVCTKTRHQFLAVVEFVEYLVY